MFDRKRRRLSHNRNSEAQDIDSLLQPALEISPDVELKEVPTTGAEYLYKVMHERARCEAVSRYKHDYTEFVKNQTCYVRPTQQLHTPDKLKPTIEWQKIQQANFEKSCKYVNRMREKWPEKGQPLSIVDNTKEEWKNIIEASEPTLTCVISVPQAILDQGLENIVEILKDIPRGLTIDSRKGGWIYSILACIHHPQHADTISILRNLARRCILMRHWMNPDGENVMEAVAPLNLFICLIGRYFKQLDLADS